MRYRNTSYERPLSSAVVDGQRVVVGDSVSFKSDVEQGGRITHIMRNAFGHVQLTLESDNDCGFSGGYIGGSSTTIELASDCWLEG